MHYLSEMILATGALGTASFGVVEGLKWTSWFGEAGFGAISNTLGKHLMTALERAYGKDYERLLRAQYRKSDQSQKELAKTLRQGIRVGLSSDDAKSLAEFLGNIDDEALSQAIKASISGQELKDEYRNVLGRFELAVDARIDASLTLARDQYIGFMRGAATLFSVGIALLAGLAMPDIEMTQAVIVGIAAVPLAPIAKDVVGALQATTKALKGKR